LAADRLNGWTRQRFDSPDRPGHGAVGVHCCSTCGVSRVRVGDHRHLVSSDDVEVLAERFAASKLPNRIFDAVKAVVVATGVFKAKTRRALDSDCPG